MLTSPSSTTSTPSRSAGQFEALGFCGTGEDTNFALATGIGPEGKLPTCTDGDLLLQPSRLGRPTLKIPEAVRQLRGTAGARQTPGAEVAVAAGAGSGAQCYNVALLGRAR
jgi:Thiolase C-terminal domain-like